MKKFRKTLTLTLTAGVLAATALTGCGAKDKEVVIYTNADDEAIDAMKAALNGRGYDGKYIMQSFGTSELGGKLLAEGKQIEADMVTMSLLLSGQRTGDKPDV